MCSLTLEQNTARMCLNENRLRIVPAQVLIAFNLLRIPLLLVVTLGTGIPLRDRPQ